VHPVARTEHGSYLENFVKVTHHMQISPMEIDKTAIVVATIIPSIGE